MGDSFIVMEARQLRDLCIKVKDTIIRCREKDISSFISGETARRNLSAAGFFGRLFGSKLWTLDEVHASYADVEHDIGTQLFWHGLINKWAHAVEICDRLMSVTHYSSHVHVSSIDLDILHAWVK
jgi:hypothetical protein